VICPHCKTEIDRVVQYSVVYEEIDIVDDEVLCQEQLDSVRNLCHQCRRDIYAWPEHKPAPVYSVDLKPIFTDDVARELGEQT